MKCRDIRKLLSPYIDDITTYAVVTVVTVVSKGIKPGGIK